MRPDGRRGWLLRRLAATRDPLILCVLALLAARPSTCKGLGEVRPHRPRTRALRRDPREMIEPSDFVTPRLNYIQRVL